MEKGKKKKNYNTVYLHLHNILRYYLLFIYLFIYLFSIYLFIYLFMFRLFKLKWKVMKAREILSN